jgi:acetolactate synthase regulatory subunit
MNRYTFAILVHNRFGVLNRVTSMFRRRRFNIASLTVSETETSAYSRITAVFDGEEATKEQLMSQLYKLPDVVVVRELDREEKRQRLTWKDMFRKREMPKFHYQPRFQSTESAAEGGEQGVGEHLAEFKKRGVKIKRRFDVTGSDDLEPVPAGRIMLYALLVCMLLYWILF